MLLSRVVVIYRKCIYQVCIWIWMKIINYFNIQLIFVIIHEFYRTF